MKKLVFIILAATFVGFLMPACGNGIEARRLEIFDVDGTDMTVYRRNRQLSANTGLRLHEGYRLLSGYSTFCYISLDATSLIKMDENTHIEINRATSSLLTVYIQQGQILLDVQNQNLEHSLEVNIGNTIVGVRGTLFIIGHTNQPDEVLVIMLEGAVEIDGVELGAGYVMRIYDEELDIARINFDELDEFAMWAVREYEDRLIEAGVIRVIPPYITIQDRQFSTDLTRLNLSVMFASDFHEGQPLTCEDILPLAYMVNLTSLFLNGHRIYDISPLAYLTNLRTVRLLNWTGTGLLGLLNLSRENGSDSIITDWSPLDHVDNVVGRPRDWVRQ